VSELAIGARGSALARVGARFRELPAWSLTAVLGLAYVIAAPASPDLAAASYRSYLFSSNGFTLWDNGWYGGHHLPAYSVLAPALGALIGPQLLAAVSMTVATALFAAAIDGRFAPRATRVAGLWFAVGASIALLSCRVPFDLGLALALGAIVLAQRGHWVGALAATVLASLASPVAGAFLALVLIAWALAGRDRAWPAVLAAAALAPIALLAVVFPEGGTQPFVPSAFYPALAGVVAIGVLVPSRHRALRIGIALYALAMIAAFAVPSAVGGNADRLGALVAGPVAACALVAAGVLRMRVLVVLAPLLLYWQANAPVADFASAVSDPATSASFYAPLLGELRTRGVGYGARPARIEVVPSKNHWEARWVAPHVMIARGWERQLDRHRNGLFYSSAPLTAASYRGWLSEQAIDYVALPDSPLDYSATEEARLLRGAGPAVAGATAYLREVWRSRHWRLFVVLRATPIAQPPARLTAATSDSFTLSAPVPGSYQVRVRFTPYWALDGGHGCVSEDASGWTRVQMRAPGVAHVVIRFSLARVFEHGPRCS
jgi:hypothetical protein